jgi:peroxiredoxin
MILHTAVLWLLLCPGTWRASPSAMEPRIVSSLAEALPSSSAPAILVFFSTECSSCYDELFQARLLVEREDWSVAVIGVCRGRLDDLETFLRKFAWRRPVVHDRKKGLFRRFNVAGVPTTIVVAGGEALCRDDVPGEFSRRAEKVEACLRRIFHRRPGRSRRENPSGTGRPAG